ncbi:MAG: hypothetical protein GXP55_06700 [Deltaproteobacteria bacterium]|nr:hypothetical protein [Deltaproteobacteria bacterium]
MAPKTRRLELTRRLPASPAALWPLLGDTNRLDRAAGLGRASYGFETHQGRRVRIGQATEMGLVIRWVEEPYEWVTARFVAGERRFLEGPAVSGGLRVELEPDGEGCFVRASWHFVGKAGLKGRLAGRMVEARFRSGLTRLLDELQALAPGATLEALASADPTSGGRPVNSDAIFGPRPEVDVAELRQRVRRVSSARVDSELRDRLETLIAEAPDEAVQQMRPFALAKAWQASRRDTLETFLHATRSGVVDLRWQVDCPVCRVSAGVHERLEDVRSEVHCDACGVDYGVGFGEHVEAVFQPNAAIRRSEPGVFCASTPAFRPHVFAQLGVDPDAPRSESMALPRGDLLLRVFGSPDVTRVEIPESRGRLALSLTDSGLSAHFEVDEACAEDELRLHSSLGDRHVVQLERADWNADAALGSIVVTFPDFRDLFATEAPAAGVDLEIGHIALLFSDLVGSTALYGRVGDARAYAMVQQHFDLMAALIAAHEGAVVKTMGDAVMASFASPADAIAAAREMVPRHDERFAERDLGLKLGVHAGPCLAVRANGVLDFFGSTVNMAARLQGKARSGELVLTQELADEPGVAAQLEGLEAQSFEAELKGIDPVPKLLRVCLDAK